MRSGELSVAPGLLGALVLALGVGTGCGSNDLGTKATAKSALGYLTPSELPDLVALIPAPPVPGSPAMARDQQARSAALLLRDTPIYARAKADAVREQPNTVADFDCALGVPIDEAATPRLYELLSRVRLDVRAASYGAKSHYARPRPFDAKGVHSCYPDDEAMVRKDGSYPSARGAVGWAYAYVLGQVAPERTEPIGRRARQFAQSRVVCDQEWQSDVDAAPAVAHIIVEHERLKPAFTDDLAAAKAEFAAQMKRGLKAPSCDAPLRLASR